MCIYAHVLLEQKIHLGVKDKNLSGRRKANDCIISERLSVSWVVVLKIHMVRMQKTDHFYKKRNPPPSICYVIKS